ncbi:MAG: hypothetical protein PVG40_14265 [Desulfobacterales bacterium]|jgi:hypothetical protein
MNGYMTIAAVFALGTVLGHFTVGSKQFLKPMLEASFDPIPKKVMHCVFHYVSTYLILSAAALLIIGSGFWSGSGSAAVAIFIALNYTIFAIWQVVLAAKSGIPSGIFKLFHWIFFVLIAVFSFLGVLF